MRQAIQIMTLILCVEASAQVDINFYTKKAKEKYRFTPDSVIVADLKGYSRDSVIRYHVEQAKKENGMFTISERTIDWVEIYYQDHKQGLRLGILVDTFSRIDFIIDTTFNSMSPFSNSSRVNMYMYYSNGTNYNSYLRPNTIERELYKQKANLFLSKPKKHNLLYPFFLFNNESSGIFLQGRYSYDYSMNMVGLQFKRQTQDAEIIIAVSNDQEMAFSYSKQGNSEFVAVDANMGLMVFPFTFIFTIGGGINYTTKMRSTEKVFALYPKLGISAGGLSLYYNYKMPIINSLNGDYNHNSITVAFGPALWKED